MRGGARLRSFYIQGRGPMVDAGEIARMILGLSKWGVVAFGAAVLAAAASARAQDRPQERPQERPIVECFSTAQTREHIMARKLAEPFASMQAASRHIQGEPIAARLCRVEEDFIYEVSLLQTNGRIVKFLVDAASGKPHSARKDR